jgi:hypothetical protein
LGEDDWHGSGRLLQRRYGSTNTGQNNLRAERNQFHRISVQTRGVAHTPAIIDP